MIKLQKNLKLRIKKTVRIKDNDWSMPGGGFLNPDTTVIVTSGPTRISDVPFQVLTGSGEIKHRHITGESISQIQDGSSGFFFSEGHKTSSPYDFGTLDAKYFEEIN